MLKKGETNFLMISIIGIIFVILIAFVITLIIVVDEDEKEELNQNVSLYFRAIDSETKEQKIAQYLIKSNSFEEKGLLNSEVLTKINIKNENTINISCWNPDYYLSKNTKEFSPEEIKNNVSTFDCEMNKVGNLEISHTGNIGDEIITLNFKSENFRYLSGVISWTTNIISVDLIENSKQCEDHNESKSGYNYCNNELFKCKLEENECILNEEVPNRLRGYNHAFSTGKNIKGNETFSFKVKSSGLDENDKITFVFYDQDLRWSNGFEYVSEENGLNIGERDFLHIIE